MREAFESDATFDRHELLAVGYGSGDATEILPMTIQAGWKPAAARINICDATRFAEKLGQEEYQGLQSGDSTLASTRNGFQLATPGKPDQFGIERYIYRHAHQQFAD